jgi:lipoyl(octanoyl) transferase
MRLAVATPGLVDYADATAWQERLVARRIAGGPDTLLLLEHPPVYTLGRGADERHLGSAVAGTVPVVRAHRGGQVTYHGPGQLVGYPILGLRGLRTDIRWYLRMLEAALIAALAEWNIEGGRVDGQTGVWVRGRKIASIGVAVRRWVTWHGFALNVGHDLGGFARITPCGLTGVEMTSIAREGGPETIAPVIPVILGRFVACFGYSGWEPEPASGSGWEASA